MSGLTFDQKLGNMYRQMDTSSQPPQPTTELNGKATAIRHSGNSRYLEIKQHNSKHFTGQR